jgi:hypothetical protein
LNWYDHHARQYDAEIGRWSAIDPSLQAVSPYMAMGNNPMMYVDADGRTWIKKAGKFLKKGWDGFWDAGNQFARWADSNGIPSAGAGYNTAQGTYHYMGDSGNVYHNQYGNNYEGKVDQAVFDARQEAASMGAAQSGVGRWGIVSDVNGYVGVAAELMRSEFKAASRHVFKYGQSYYKDGKRLVKSALQITRESQVFNLKGAKLFGRIGAKTVVANTVINGAEFAMNPTIDQGVWSAGMVGLGVVGVACPPLLGYSLLLDRIGKDVIQQSWENKLHMYREYRQLPRYF